MSHDEASDLLAAYALDAVDGDEFTELEEHLETCPRCRAELDSLREVAAAMGNSVEPLPEGLVVPDRPPAARPPGGRGAAADAAARGRRAARRSGAPAAGPTRRRRVMVGTVGAIAVAAAAVAVVLGIGLVQADNKVSNLQGRLARGDGRPAGTRAPAGRPGLDRARRAEQAKVVVLPSGQGYLVSSTLPSLDKGRTYQLWAIEGNQPISLGLLGGSPGQAAFTMAGSTRPSHLSITAEPAGGSVFPTGPIIATGTV